MSPEASATRLPRILFAVIFVFVLWTGLRAIDFGYHWDEQPIMLKPLIFAVDSRQPLPHAYVYPSLVYDLGFAALGVDAAAYFLRHNTQSLHDVLIQVIASPSFLLRMRCLMVLLSSLAGLWVYFLTRLWTKNEWIALFSGALFFSSWEVAYHSRWFTVDSLLMQLSIATLLCMELARRSDWKKWGFFAAFVAGLGAGTKQTGILLFIPIVVALLLERRADWKRQTLQFGAVFAGTFLLTTPGFLLEPHLFFHYIREQSKIYAGGFSVYSVDAGFEHSKLLLSYLSRVIFSPYQLVALFFFLLSLIGFAALFKADRKGAFVFLSFPIAYLLLFISHRVMIVRNYLVFVPVLAVLAGLGLNRIPRGVIFGSVMALLLVLNFSWLYRASESIVQRGQDQSAAVEAFLAQHPDRGYLVLHSQAIPFEDDHTWKKLANRYNSAFKSFGPFEVNFNYYPTWQGDDRILLVPTVLFDEYTLTRLRPGA